MTGASHLIAAAVGALAACAMIGAVQSAAARAAPAPAFRALVCFDQSGAVTRGEDWRSCETVTIVRSAR